MVGDDALVDYPHPRHACAVFKFDSTNHKQHCPKLLVRPAAPPRSRGKANPRHHELCGGDALRRGGGAATYPEPV